MDLRIKEPFSEVVDARADWNVNKTAHNFNVPTYRPPSQQQHTCTKSSTYQ